MYEKSDDPNIFKKIAYDYIKMILNLITNQF